MITAWRGQVKCVAAALALVAGCAGDPPLASETALARCAVPVEVAVATAGAPAFSWTPQCGADRLMVDDLAAPGDLYAITWGLVGGSERIPPEVQYGVVPPGTNPLGPGSDLTAGREYRVRVLRYTDSGEVLLGQALFTP